MISEHDNDPYVAEEKNSSQNPRTFSVCVQIGAKAMESWPSAERSVMVVLAETMCSRDSSAERHSERFMGENLCTGSRH